MSGSYFQSKTELVFIKTHLLMLDVRHTDHILMEPRFFLIPHALVYCLLEGLKIESRAPCMLASLL